MNEDQRDQELDTLLAKARTIQPSAHQVARWKEAVSSRTSQRFLLPKSDHGLARFAAAVAMGFVLGSISPTRFWPADRVSSSEPEPVATIQFTFANME